MAKPPRAKPAPPAQREKSGAAAEAGLWVVGIGASAGGLEACTKLVSALNVGPNVAFILVQHLEPTHDSMMAALLSGHTALTVLEAGDGMPVQPGHLYVIPPGAYLSVAAGLLHLSQPKARRGARLPFDFLLSSLAAAYGPKAVCIVLSGSGADGSLGLRDVKAKGGLVMVQSPSDAGYDGMPQSAIDTGDADVILPAAAIPEALDKHVQPGDAPEAEGSVAVKEPDEQVLTAIIDLVRQQTAQDFNHYKRGTLQRRVERRMAMASIGGRDMAEYLRQLRTDPAEVAALAKDLLINVTSFFRDPKVFGILERTIIPEMVRTHPADDPLRIWTVGCSTGEETYSLTMLFHEQINIQRSNLKLPVFASDLDADAVATARDGLYPAAIAADISEARLKRFFVKEDHGYRVVPDLRAAVVFAVQDMLVDPPFSRLDFVSCRNLLIYLLPDAQARAISLFHFALRKKGVLLLGSAETVGKAAGRFEIISEEARLYRHIGRSRPGDIGFSMIAGGAGRPKTPVSEPARPGSRQMALAELGRRLVLERHAPATILINRRNECVFSLGPTDRYFRMAPGMSTLDVLAMARPGLRPKLGAAIQQVLRDQTKLLIPAARIVEAGQTSVFDIEIEPVQNGGEDLLLICFLSRSTESQAESAPQATTRPRRLKGNSQREIEALRTELQNTIHDLELSSEEQKAINQEALSVNEEHQSTNEELMTSKEEIQSLNEELTALNSQLQETLERHRTTSDDLQNVLYSTDVATLFLDKNLNIRFFTPATRSLFAIIPSDIGRPIADLQPATPDSTLSSDAWSVLKTLEPIEREIEARDGIWFRRRMLPYRTSSNAVEGVVITFTDVTKRIHAAEALEIAKRQADDANITKSKFLAAASHDLRQPLQTMSLLQGLLAKTVEGQTGQGLVARLDDTLTAMSTMLNTLLDINQIDAGIVHPRKVDFLVDDFLLRMRDEFSYHAQAKGLRLVVAPCSLWVHSDPRLLEQMVRNLLSNAMKYTKQGKIVVGCRRHAGWLSLQVWDTGIGIPEKEFGGIFEEYHQLDNPARERSRRLGLGLSIVQRLGALLQHRIGLHSTPGSGSMFSIDIPLAQGAPKSAAA
jgi:two-component system CheB/CheR fusion protein